MCKTQAGRLKTSPVFATHCLKAFNLEKYTARYRTPCGPAPGRGTVCADHCVKQLNYPAGVDRFNIPIIQYDLSIQVIIKPGFMYPPPSVVVKNIAVGVGVYGFDFQAA